MNNLLMAIHVHTSATMLRVQKAESAGLVIFTLSGRIEQRDLLGLKELLQGDTSPAAMALDLQEVRLVDREVIVFLASCESAGIKLKNCPPYVRMWIDTGRDTQP